LKTRGSSDAGAGHGAVRISLLFHAGFSRRRPETAENHVQKKGIIYLLAVPVVCGISF
jgi:hypothetical protein